MSCLRIPGFPGYWADELGNIWSSMEKRNGRTWIDSGIPHKKLSTHPHHDTDRTTKRLCVVIRVEGKRKTLMVHRAVALAHLPNPRKLPLVRHLDDNSLNNVLSNLQWGTAKINAQDRQRNAKADERIRELEYELNKFRSLITVADLYKDVA